jgi:hypothetical protein
MSANLESFLKDVGLERYATPLAENSGISSVEQLWSLDEAGLTDVATKAGMLKGHIMKFKRSVDEKKQSGEASVSAPGRTGPASTQPTNLGQECDGLVQKLQEIEAMKTSLDNFKSFIVGLNIQSYKAIIDELETL